MRVSERHRARIAQLLDQVAEIDQAQTGEFIGQRLDLTAEIAHLERLAVQAEIDEKADTCCTVPNCGRHRVSRGLCVHHARPQFHAEAAPSRRAALSVGNPAQLATRIADELRGAAEVLSQEPLYPADVERVAARLHAEVTLLRLLKENMARAEQ